jgi:DNA-binding NarL/FixJ family response regulator
LNALIVARPSIFRDGLTAWLSTIRGIKVVAITANLDSALESVHESCPSLVVLVTDGLDTEYLAQVQALKASRPRIRIIAIVEDPKEVRVCEEGAVDAALVTGVRSEKLTEVVSEVLHSTAGADRDPPDADRSVALDPTWT